MATVTSTTALSAAAATATATAAASSSSKHRPASLPTPKSATYPSSLHSPLLPTPTYLKREESLKTPVTPPPSYLDFLNKLSPAIKSPLSTGQSTTFSFSNPRSPAASFYPPAPASARPALPSNPSSSSVDSHDSVSTNASVNTSRSAPAANSSKPLTRTGPTGDASLSFPPRSSSTSQVPSAASTRPVGPIRRPSLMIPPSPSTRSPSLMSPASASASAASRIRSPVSAGAAAKAYYTSMSPVDSWGQVLSAGAAQTRPVSVRQVVTRTVTYTARRPEPASATAAVSSASDGPTIKQESSTGLVASGSDQTDGQSQKSHQPPLVGDAPRGKRRKIE